VSIIRIADLIDVVVSAWARWSPRKRLIADRLTETELGLNIEGARDIVVTGVRIAANCCLEEETLTCFGLRHPGPLQIFVVVLVWSTVVARTWV
jgi:hypothetical protein